MDKRLVTMPALFDLYGNMFTAKQKEFFVLYYHHDLSLAEIAEQYGISRQGVHDIVRRVEKTLETLEDKLGCLRWHEGMQARLKVIADELERIELCDDCKSRESLTRAKQMIAGILA